VALNRLKREASPQNHGPFSLCLNTHDGKVCHLEELPKADVISLGDILSGYVSHPEIKSLVPDGKKCQAQTRGLLHRMAINSGLQHCIGKEVSRFEEGKNDFIESVDDMCINYDGGRVAANESLIAENQQTWIAANDEGDRP
jgi:hypothetical protein